MQLQRPPVGQRHAILSMLNQAKLILEHWIEKGHTVNWRHELYTGSYDIPENRLVRLAQSGNDAAFQELMNRAHGACLSIAIGLLNDRDDAADEVQNAFWKAYINIRSFNQQSRFSTWVTRILINLCYMRLRRAGRIRFISYDNLTPDGETYTAYTAVDYRTPEIDHGGAEVNKLLRNEVERLPKVLRIPLELYYLHDVPIVEIARQLNLSIAATKSRLHRAQIFLRDRMTRHCGARGSGTLLSSESRC